MNTSKAPIAYQTRLNRVIDHIYDHLDDDIRFDDLAEIACLSPWHWHRVYTAMRGETITETIRRLRLSRAAERLANSDLALDAIARRAGYSSADAFGRAFKDAYGKSPADYRESGSHAAFRAALLAEDGAGFPVSMETLAPIRCVSIAHAGSYMQIDRAMGRLFSALAAQDAVAPDRRMMAVFYDDPDLVPVEDLRSRACSPVADGVALAPPIEEAMLRGGLYARLRYQGPYADMKGAYRWLLGVWLPQSGHEPDDAPMFEAYLNSPQQVAPNALVTDIHLPLRAS
ncbi:MAG: AraC family transcriptional regulator [Devosia sp. 67-54]|uniref:AraC family transcriptional regulator n=1 Tax=unclassified Devosia TaxID=196773 RepID=UPI0009681C4A|nr:MULTISPECIES: AraC family transcriptional regulator [unclassified Devosia]MBN9304386.1 AraC family transcriptional regulator [Devosia sp.]OJX18187.1 MAG: AraC family transcriptional regulator [Devosia sp. 67-54]